MLAGHLLVVDVHQDTRGTADNVVALQLVSLTDARAGNDDEMWRVVSRPTGQLLDQLAIANDRLVVLEGHNIGVVFRHDLDSTPRRAPRGLSPGAASGGRP